MATARVLSAHFLYPLTRAFLNVHMIKAVHTAMSQSNPHFADKRRFVDPMAPINANAIKIVSSIFVAACAVDDNVRANLIVLRLPFHSGAKSRLHSHRAASLLAQAPGCIAANSIDIRYSILILMTESCRSAQQGRTPARLGIIIPCYNETDVLPKTLPMFLEELDSLKANGLVTEDSFILFVDDGSKDGTWDSIVRYSLRHDDVRGIRQSRNRGHQNALLAGLMEVKDSVDVTITIDCDGQDDVGVMGRMIRQYGDGSEIVYGVRDSRESDSWFKRTSANCFYHLMETLGAETVRNHADYRLVSARALQEFANYHEVNLFLRGLFVLVGFQSSQVYYTREQRVAGRSHYPLRKMIGLALNGITSLSVKPIRMVTVLGMMVSILGFCGVIYAVASLFIARTVSGWTSLTCIICFLGGMQLFCLGVIGEYVGKIYLETKARPRYIISDRTEVSSRERPR
ncbi:MAG: glycosyltransferase family 2 protein [Bifidobacterium crudilactis]